MSAYPTLVGARSALSHRTLPQLMATGQPCSTYRVASAPGRLFLAALLVIAATACARAKTPDVAVSVPRRSGDVWELDSVSSRSTAAASLLAFVTGTHVLLVDGDATYAGMRVTAGGQAPDGAQPLALSSGIGATLAPRGEVMQLRFSSGEVLALRRRAAGAGQ